MPPLSRAQYQGLYWTGCFASLSSIFGSTMVAWHCNSRRKTSMQHRLLFALSCTDLISSIMLMGLPSFVPEGTPGHFFAVGNATSCAVSGFFFVACFLATTFLNAGLSLYFLFTIRYGADPLTLRKRLELPLYILAPLICLLVATLGVIAQGYVPVPIFNSCFLGTCSISDIYEGGGCPEYNSVQDAYPDILSAVYISLVGIVTVPSCVATGLVYWTVRQRIRGRGVTSISFGFQNTSPEIAKKKLKLIGSQAIAYTLIYMNLLTWSLVLNILHVAAIKGQDLEGSTWSYILQLLSWLFIPGQGFLNCLAYSRPTYLLWKQRHHSDLPRWRLYWNALRMQDPGSGTVSLSMTPGAADSQGSGPRRQGYENPSTTKLEDSIVKNSPAETTATSEPEPPRRKLSSSVRGSSCLPAIDEDRSSQNFGLEEKEEPPPAPANEILTPPGGHRNVALQRKQESVDPLAEEQRLAWEAYSLANTDWIFEAREDESLQETFHYIEAEDQGGIRHNHVISEKIYDFDFDKIAIEVDEGPGPYAPLWQSSPVLPWPRDLVNYNAFHHPTYSPFGKAAFETGLISLGLLDTGPPGGIDHPSVNTFIFAHLLSAEAKKNTNYTGEPFSSIFIPIMDTLDVMKENRKPVALLVSIIRWASYFENILTDEDSDRPLHVVLSNSCQDPVTYEIRGTSATYLGVGNRADSKYHDLMVQTDLDGSKLVIEPDTIALTVNQELCNYTLKVYPTQQGDDYYNDNFPLFITLIVAAVFVFTMGVFVVYDSMVEKRQRKVLDTAKRSTAIVSSMFPRKVRDQLLQAPVQGNATKLRYFANEKKASGGESPFQVAPGLESNSKPIADLFPDCTVMFADVEGFTAWSSVREPSQVFTFLEGIYSAFDAVAARRVVFKVETVGDCYVAVCGLPDPRDDHAVVMARFACDCIAQHIETVRKLELTLGPETGDLRIRIGLHSGPITAGVLRGERSRFQIFGDTVNTAARLESSGQGNAIHLSAATARLIKDAGHGAWIEAREDAVHLKGKGTLSTFWLTLNRNDLSLSSRTSNSTSCQRSIISTTSDTVVDFRKERLVAWNAEILIKLLKQVIASRDGKSKRHTPLEEVIEIIQLPNQKSKRSTKKRIRDPTTIEIEPSITELVHNYVGQLASMHHDNHFHNFEHASHVTMSVAKLLSRIVAPSDMDFMDGAQAETKLHDHTYGITSDPLTQFACVLSALIHDADHQGVSNTTLVEEGDDLTQLYGTKSLAEQNSVDRAWDLLMSPRFRPLIAVLCRGDAELKLLRQLVVNSVMATDIMDPDLKMLRNARWDKAFKKSQDCNDEDTSSEQAINRKATIVIEHLIQASDVSHTMQHWNVYTKWNARLFKEMYKAHIDGRAGAKDPSVFWAKGEIGFFDFYIIPLAKKLKDCGVFGVSSDEYLQYAISNRNEWEAKGERMVQRLIAEVHQEFHTSPSLQRKF